MAISYTPVDIRGHAVEPIFEEILYANKTIEKGYVVFNDRIKANTIISEGSVDVTAQLYTGQALSSSGSMTVTDRAVTPLKLEYKQTFLEEALRTSRFNRDMKPGAWNIESNEFASKVLATYGANVSEDAEAKFWGAISSTTKTAIAALTPGAGQGSITAATQTAVAALTADATGMDGVFAKLLYDNGALGSYIKVTGTTVTSSNIAAEFSKIYQAIPANVLENTKAGQEAVIWAPRAWKQLIKIANNAVGAAQQVNFLVEGSGASERIFYNGVEIFFVPTPNNLMAYANSRDAISWNTDLVDDVTRFEVGKVANDGDLKFVRAIYTMAAHVVRAANGVLYGG